MKQYDFGKVEELSNARPRKFKLETNLIGKKLAEHMANGYQLVN